MAEMGVEPMRFSVIVPVYKVEPYLRQCVDSILGQTCRDFELILVDDGSPDGCPAICDEYAALDRRVKVIHKPNGGLVSARQAGLEIAQGEYIVPVDSDDWIALDYLEQASDLLEKYEPEMVCFDCIGVKKEKIEILQNPVQEGLYDETKIKKQLWPKILKSEQNQSLLYPLWTKIYKKELIESHQIKVSQDISYAEDVVCIVPIYFDVKRVYISHKSFYYYRILEKSMSHGFSTKKMNSILLLIQSMKRMDQFSVVEEQMNRAICIMALETVGDAIKTGQKDALREVKKFIKNPRIAQCLRSARFKRINPENSLIWKIYLRIILFVLQCGWIYPTIVLLTLWEKMKLAGIKEWLVRLHLYH